MFLLLANVPTSSNGPATSNVPTISNVHFYIFYINLSLDYTKLNMMQIKLAYPLKTAQLSF